MKNPLVVFLGIGEYHGNMSKLNSVEKDFRNIRVAFCVKNGYSMIYMNVCEDVGNNDDNYDNYDSYGNYGNYDDEDEEDDDEDDEDDDEDDDDAKDAQEEAIIFFDGQTVTPNNYTPYDALPDNHKLKMTWSREEIELFNEKIVTKLDSNDFDFDSLIYIVSCHGEDNADGTDVLYSSDMEEILPYELFREFDNELCEALRCKPKMFIIEACRGTMRPRAMLNEAYIDTVEDNNDPSPHLKHVLIRNNQNNDTKKQNKKQVKKENSGNSKETKQSLIDKYIQMRIVEAREAAYFLRGRDFMTVYAVPRGFKALDGGTKGGFLIRTLTKMMVEIVAEKAKQGESVAVYPFLKKCQNYMEYIMAIKYGTETSVNSIEINDSSHYNIHIQSKLRRHS